MSSLIPSRMRSYAGLASVLLAGLLLASPAFPQGTITGTILGTVTDQSGAVLPGATVKATNVTTGLVRSTTANETGNYTIPFLPVGTYNVSAEMTGFKTQTKTGLTLEIEQKAVVNFTLPVGSVSEQVTVTAETNVLRPQSADISEVIENQRVTQLPLNGRQFVQLVMLTPGTTPEPQGIFSTPFAVAGQSPNVNGNRSDGNNYLLDGISLNDLTYNHLAASPSVDAIQEVKVQSGLYTADFGSAPGAQINATLRSGTNEFHGSAWEFVRNDIFDARNFFDLKNVSPFRQNQFGGTLGGPIVKDKTFFFFNYERLSIRKAVPITSSVPTEAMRRGDFRGVANIFDATKFNPATNTSPQFDNNQIPPERFSSVAKALLPLIPLPNLSSGLGRNFAGSGKRSLGSDQVNARVDHNFGARDLLFGRFTFSDISDLEPIPLTTSFETASAPLSPPGFGQNTSVRNVNVASQYTHIFSPRLTNEVRLGYNYTGTRQFQENTTDFSSQVGIQGNDSRFLSNGIPVFNITGFSSIGGTTFDLNWRNHTYTVIDDLVFIRGKHTLKAGFSFDRLQPNTQFLLSPRGSFTFRALFFTRDPQNPGTTGNAFADFLLGLPNLAAVGVGDTLVHLRAIRTGSYFQDDWKVTSNLTLNLGIRYELATPFHEKRNRWANLDIRTGNFVLASDDAKINPLAQISSFPTLTFVTDQQAGFPNALVDTDSNNFAPRIGLAWTPFGDKKTVIRSGYGIYYTQVNASDGLSFNPPFFGNKQFNNTSLSNLIQVQDALVSRTAVTPNAQAIAKDRIFGYVQQWSFNIQRELRENWLVEGIYLGSKGTKLGASVQPNQAFPGTTPIAQRLIYPQLAPTVAFSVPWSSSSYNSLTLRAEKRYSRGLVLSMNYTWAHSLDNASSTNSTAANNNKPQNSRDLRSEWASSIFDARHRFVFNSWYELPFGPGKALASGVTGAAKHLVEGWSVAGIITVQSRLPFSPLVPFDRSGAGTNQDRPDVVGDPNRIDRRTPDRFFNTDAFVLQPAGRFGNAGRNIIRGPNFRDVDFSVLKLTKIAESKQLEFRVESFNLLNQANFKQPNKTFGTADFGRVFSAQDAREIQFGLKFIF